MEEQTQTVIDQNVVETSPTISAPTAFWNEQLNIATNFESDFKNHSLPLARIKKVMKSDQEVKAACEIFITEITMRAWIHAEENKRRTLQRSDVASAVNRSDQFDFLIDIVPREEMAKTVNRRQKEETSTEQVFSDQNVSAYYTQQPGLQFTSENETASYFQQSNN
ncbi:14419_t:CDS:2 [Entrophospora sp. SA101]|nr:2185_t:CDS:2 [Entrophospora sp. SA101]CAJ0840403.1 14419_t:CDS:2 [Entrophospora sp. SA101]